MSRAEEWARQDIVRRIIARLDRLAVEGARHVTVPRDWRDGGQSPNCAGDN